MNARSIPTLVAAAALLALPLATAGCGTTGMNFREAFSGVSKREKLAQRITDARNAHMELKGRFTAAHDASIALMNNHDSEHTPEQLYDALKLEIRRTEAATKTTRRRVSEADTVAEMYFESWRAELAQYNRDELRSFSQGQLDHTEQSYQDLRNTFKFTDEAIDPILGALKDQVRFLDKNLSDRAIATLTDNMVDVDREIAELNARLDNAIAQSDPFVAMLGEDPNEGAPVDDFASASDSDPAE